MNPENYGNELEEYGFTKSCQLTEFYTILCIQRELSKRGIIPRFNFDKENEQVFNRLDDFTDESLGVVLGTLINSYTERYLWGND